MTARFVCVYVDLHGKRGLDLTMYRLMITGPQSASTTKRNWEEKRRWWGGKKKKRNEWEKGKEVKKKTVGGRDLSRKITGFWDDVYKCEVKNCDFEFFFFYLKFSELKNI